MREWEGAHGGGSRISMDMRDHNAIEHHTEEGREDRGSSGSVRVTRAGQRPARANKTGRAECTPTAMGERSPSLPEEGYRSDRRSRTAEAGSCSDKGCSDGAGCGTAVPGPLVVGPRSPRSPRSTKSSSGTASRFRRSSALLPRAGGAFLGST